MRVAKLRVATRRGCNNNVWPVTCSDKSGGTRVLLPDPGGAVSTKRRRVRAASRIAGKMSSIGSVSTGGMLAAIRRLARSSAGPLRPGTIDNVMLPVFALGTLMKVGKVCAPEQELCVTKPTMFASTN